MSLSALRSQTRRTPANLPIKASGQTLRRLAPLVAGVCVGCALWFVFVRPTPSARAINAAEPAARKPHLRSAGSLLANENLSGETYRSGLIISGSTPHRMLLFTFDDGPNWNTTPLLLDYLDSEGIRAVFFLSMSRLQGDGFREQQQRAIAQDIARRGHLVANHTVQHLQLPTMNNSDLATELDNSEQIFREIFGAKPWLIRPPGGARSDRIDDTLAARGYTTVLWNINSGDVYARTPDSVLATWRKVMHRREREFGEQGGIILMHDTHPWTIEAVRLVVNDIRATNCRLLARGQELFDIVDDLAYFYAPRRQEPASTFAPPAKLPNAVFIERQTRLRAHYQDLCSKSLP